MNEEEHRIAVDKYYNGQKLSLIECIIINAFEALESDENGNSKVKCPNDGCNGTLVLKESRHEYGPYVGCTSKACNFYITIKKMKEMKDKKEASAHEELEVKVKELEYPEE